MARKDDAARKRGALLTDIAGDPATTPPHSPVSEEIVIAATIGMGRGITQHAWIESDWFYADHWRKTWHAADRLLAQGKATDKHAVLGLLDVEYGRDYADHINALINAARRAHSDVLDIDIDGHARIVEGYYVRRRAIELGRKAIMAGLSGDDDALDAILLDFSRLDTHAKGVDDDYSAREAALMLIHDTEQIMSSPDGGITTGIANLDEMMGPLQPGDLIVIAATTSMGKSALSLSVARLISARLARLHAEHRSILGDEHAGGFIESCEYVTLEMSTIQQMRRFAAGVTDVSVRDLGFGFRKTLGDTPDYDAFVRWSATFEAEMETYGDHLYFHQQTNSVSELRLMLRRAIAAGRVPRVVVIDASEYINADGKGDVERYGNMYREYKDIAREFGIVIFALHQLNREVDASATHVPLQSYLYASGQVERAADMILLLYAPKYYWPYGSFDTSDLFLPEDAGQMYTDGLWVTLSKARNGNPGKTRPVRFIREKTLICDWPAEWSDVAFQDMTNRANGTEKGGA